MRAVVHHGTENLAARAVRHRVIEEQRGVGMLAAIEQIDAVGLDPGMLAGNRDDGLIAADRSATGHRRTVEMRARAERHDRGGNIEGLAAVLDQAH